jgi:hypothetical protein
MCDSVYVLLDEIYLKNTEGYDIICSLKRHIFYDVSCVWTTDSRQHCDERSLNRPVNNVAAEFNSMRTQLQFTPEKGKYNEINCLDMKLSRKLNEVECIMCDFRFLNIIY